MAKKMSEMSDAELREELKKEREKSDALQRDKEARDKADEDRKREEKEREDRVRADAAAAKDTEPTEEQWVALEAEYGATRENIRGMWKMARRMTTPLMAELNSMRTRDAANEAVRLAKEGARAEDPQFSKYERHVDEFLSDIPASDKADPEKLKRHMERALLYGQGKARKTDKSYREEADITRDNGDMSDDEKKDAAEHFGEFAIAGMPLTIVNEKKVPDDFRRRHAHPEQKEGVRMNMKHQWNEQVPKKPR